MKSRVIKKHTVLETVRANPGRTASEIGKLLSTPRHKVKWGSISSRLCKMCHAGQLRRKIGASVRSIARRKEVEAAVAAIGTCSRWPQTIVRYSAWRYYPVTREPAKKSS